MHDKFALTSASVSLHCSTEDMLSHCYTRDILSHCVICIVGYPGSAAVATMLCVHPTAVCLCLHSSERLLVLLQVSLVSRSGRRSSAPAVCCCCSRNLTSVQIVRMSTTSTSTTATTTTSTSASKTCVRAFPVWLCLWRFLLQHMNLHEDSSAPYSSTRHHSRGTHLTPSTLLLPHQQVNRRTAWAGLTLCRSVSSRSTAAKGTTCLARHGCSQRH